MGKVGIKVLFQLTIAVGISYVRNDKIVIIAIPFTAILIGKKENIKQYSTV